MAEDTPTSGVPVQGMPVQGVDVTPKKAPKKLEAPTVQDEPAIKEPAITAPPAEPSQPNVLGDLPKWSTVLGTEKYRMMGKGEQRKHKDRWLDQMMEQNPHWNEADEMEIRRTVQNMNQDNYPITIYDERVIEKELNEAKGMVQARFDKSDTKAWDEGSRPQGDKRDKGPGWLGELNRPDGAVSTELSISLQPEGYDKPIEIPTLVPTLTDKERDHLLDGGDVTDEIRDKAVQHAEKQKRLGKSPFKGKDEEIGLFDEMPPRYTDGGKTEVVGELKAERLIREGMVSGNLAQSQAYSDASDLIQTGISKFGPQVGRLLMKGLTGGKAESLSELFDPYGAIEKRVEDAGGTGWYIGDSYLRSAQVLGAGTSYTFGGLEGAVEEERRVARLEGRSKMYRDMDPIDRYAELKKVVHSDDYVGMDERIADVVKDVFIPAGLNYKQIDSAILRGIESGDFPDQEFFRDGLPAPGFEKVERPEFAEVKRDPFTAMGDIKNQEFDTDAAGKAFWENVSDWDNIKYKDASTHRKLTKGKTFEEKYGFWKGMTANVFLSIVADPLSWPFLLYSLPAKVTTKFAATSIAKTTSRALSGRMGLIAQIELLKDVVKHAGKGSKLTGKGQEIVDNAKAIIKGFRNEAEFAGKDGNKMTALLDEAEALIGTKPVDDLGNANASKVNDVIDKANDAGADLDKIDFSNIPVEGTSMATQKVETLGEVARKAGQTFAPDIKEVPVAPAIADVGEESIEQVAKTTGAYDMSHIVNTIPDSTADVAKKAGQVKEGFVPAVAKEAIEEAPEVAPVARTTGNLKIPEVGKGGIYDDIGEGVEQVSSRGADDLAEEGLEAARKTEAQAMNDVADLTAAKAEKSKLDKMRVHDEPVRRQLTNAFKKYEQALDDVSTTPPARDSLYKNLVKTWEKHHPGDKQLDEFKRVLDERRVNRAGEVLSDTTGSDLIDDLGPVRKPLGKPTKLTPEEYQKKLDEIPVSKAEEQKLIDAHMAKAKITKKHATPEVKIASEGGEGIPASTKASLQKNGIDVVHSGGGEQIGSVRQGLGYTDDFMDSLTAGVNEGEKAVATGLKNQQKLKNSVKKEFGRKLTKEEDKLVDKVINDTLFGGKTPAQLDEVLATARKQADELSETGGRKKFTAEEGKADRKARNTKKREDARKARKPTVTRNADGSYTRTKTINGKRVSTKMTPSEHDNGEYLGSIFGMAQKFWDRMATKGTTKIVDDAGAVSRLRRNPFSIEYQFKDWPVIGKAIKNSYSIMETFEEWTLDAMQRISKMGNTGRNSLMGKGTSKLTDLDIQQIPLLFENMKKFASLPLTEQRRLKPVMDEMDNFFEFFKKKYAEFGVDVDFKMSFQDGLKNVNGKINGVLDDLRKGKTVRMSNKKFADLGIHNVPENFDFSNKALVGRTLKNHAYLNEQILAQTKDMKYINIPYAMWFESGFDKAGALKAFKLANVQKRATFRIQDLIDSGAIDASQVNLFDIMAAYGRRASKDLAMLNIKSAMKKSNQLLDVAEMRKLVKEGKMTKAVMGGKIKTARGQGWSQLDPRQFPMMNRAYVSDPMREWLTSVKTQQLNANNYDKFLSGVKGFQFANPFFLPLYDLQQAAASRGMLGMLNLKGWAIDMKWAASQMKNRGDEYWEVLHAGQQSKPMALPYDQYMGKVEMMKDTNAGKYLSQLIKKNKFKGLYNVSWDSAWGMDKFVRFSTTHYNMRKWGMDVFEAAQTSALIHSDYADVPVKLRRGANRVMFTPTFKVTMFRSYGQQLKNMAKVPYYKATGRGAELTKQEKAMARAGGGLISMLVGLDLFMTGKGYERDQFARRYYQQVETEQGLKENVAVFSSPLNMIPKYAYKFADIANVAYKDDRLGKIWSTFKWDTQPVYRITLDIINNKKDNGRPIYLPYIDSDMMMSAKIGAHATEQVFQIVRTIGVIENTEEQQQAWDLYKKDMGQLFAYALKPNTFQYLRQPATQRYVRKIKKMQTEYKRILKDLMETGKYNEQDAERGFAELERRQEAIVKMIDKAENFDERTWFDRMKGGVGK